MDNTAVRFMYAPFPLTLFAITKNTFGPDDVAFSPEAPAVRSPKLCATGQCLIMSAVKACVYFWPLTLYLRKTYCFLHDHI